MSVIWITEVPEFHLEADGGVRVVLTSGKEAIEIGLSQHHCRSAADTILRILDREAIKRQKRVRKMERH